MTDVQWKDIVKEEKRHCAHIKKTFEGPVLGYITPVSLYVKKNVYLNWCSDIKVVVTAAKKESDCCLH